MAASQSQAGARFPILRVLPSVGGREPVPPGYYRAVELFERASQRAQDDACAEAADTCLQAAVALRAPVDSPYAASLRACREIAYSNAWECHRCAGQEQAGRSTLTQAARDDKELATAIRALIKEP